MKKYKRPCRQCGNRKYLNSYTRVEEGKLATYCDKCQRGETSQSEFSVLPDKRGLRALHWNEIRSRVTTHEGELLHGNRGVTYQKKYSQKYLGRDLGSVRPINQLDVEKHERQKSS